MKRFIVAVLPDDYSEQSVIVETLQGNLPHQIIDMSEGVDPEISRIQEAERFGVLNSSDAVQKCSAIFDRERAARIYLSNKFAEINEELEITNKLLDERNRVIAAIPGCPVHGDQCIPHAIDWILQAKLLMPFPSDDAEPNYIWPEPIFDFGPIVATQVIDASIDETEDARQMIYALERAANDNEVHAEHLMKFGDYGAQFPANDAEQIRKVIAFLRDYFEIPEEKPRLVLNGVKDMGYRKNG